MISRKFVIGLLIFCIVIVLVLFIVAIQQVQLTYKQDTSVFVDNGVLEEEVEEDIPLENEELECDGGLCRQKTVVLLVNFIDDESEPISHSEVKDIFFNFNNPNSVNSYLKEVSFGKDWLFGDVLGWFTLPVSQEDCESFVGFPPNVNNIIEEVDPFVDFSLYDEIFILYSKGVCTWGNRGYYNVEASTNEGLFYFPIVVRTASPNIIQENYYGALVHEFGHGIGLQHATVFECGNQIVGELGETCEINERGNLYDSMGVSSLHGHFNSFYKEQLGWFNENNIIEVTGNGGEYLLEPLETPTDGIQMIKIPVQYNLEYHYQSTHYFIEYRQPIGYDSNFEKLEDESNGILIYLASELTDTLPYRAHLLDMTPHITSNNYPANEDNEEPFLRLGETFIDSNKGISITFSDVSEGGALINVEIE